jgi:hypothetical protein
LVSAITAAAILFGSVAFGDMALMRGNAIFKQAGNVCGFV